MAVRPPLPLAHNPDLRCSGGVPELPEQIGALRQHILGWAVEPALDAEIPVVAVLLQRGKPWPKVQVAATGLQSVAVRDMDVHDVTASRSDTRAEVGLLDAHVKKVRHRRHMRPG